MIQDFVRTSIDIRPLIWDYILTRDGSGSGLDADTLDGHDTSYFATTAHTHPTSDIVSGTLLHERGGLEADVSAYNGLLKISGGATSSITDNSSNWDTAFGWGDHASAGYAVLTAINTFTNFNTFETSTNYGTPLIIEGTSAGDGGPVLVIKHTSGSPAVDDFPGGVLFQGNNSLGVTKNYASFYGHISNATSGTEEGTLDVWGFVSGVESLIGRFGSTIALSYPVTVGGVSVPTISSSSILTNKTIDLTDNTLSGTKSEFDTALSDDNFAYVGTGNTFTENQLVERAAGGGLLALHSTVTNGNDAEFHIRKSRSSGVITSGDDIGTIRFQAHDGTSFVDAVVMSADSSGVISTGTVGGLFNLLTNGTLRFSIGSSGGVGIGAAPTGGDLGAGTLNVDTSISVDNNLVPAPASQAEGDLLYRGSSSWSRLAKGTANQVLAMNSGATAPEWISKDTGIRSILAINTADQTSTSTSLANITSLTFSIAASETWYFEALLNVSASSAAGTPCISVNGPASPSSVDFNVFRLGTVLQTNSNHTAFEAVDTTAASGASSLLTRVSGRIVNGANAGTIALRVRRQGGSGTATIHENSILRAWRIS